MSAPMAGIDFDRSGAHLTVYVSGELDQESAPPLTGIILRHMDPADKVLWIDLNAVTFCGSAGVAMFMALHQRCDDQGTRLTLYRPSRVIVSMLDMLGLDQLRVWSDARSSTPHPVRD